MEDRLFKIAAETMKTSEEVARKNYKELVEYNAVYFWNPERGGIAVIVGFDGEKLGAMSGISFDEHLRNYLEGRRN